MRVNWIHAPYLCGSTIWAENLPLENLHKSNRSWKFLFVQCTPFADEHMYMKWISLSDFLKKQYMLAGSCVGVNCISEIPSKLADSVVYENVFKKWI